MANVSTGQVIAAADHNSIVAAIKGTAGENLTVFTKGVDLASASALILGADGNYWHVTGTVAVTSISSLPAGTVIKLEFDSALLLTHNATTLILQGATSYTTAAGDIFEFTSEGSGNWRETGRGLSATTTTIASTFGATPSLTFSTTNSAGTGTGFVRRNATLALFDTTVARALAFGDVGTVGSTSGFVSHVLHGHPMPTVLLDVPSLTLSTTNAAGSSTSAIRRDATIALFDTTAARSVAFGDVGTTGGVNFASPRDHGHAFALGATVVASVGNYLGVASTNGTLGWSAITSTAMNVQTFTSVGTALWTKPAGTPTLVRVIAFGAGGGGSGGEGAAAGSYRRAGTGGGGGAIVFRDFDPSVLGATEIVTIGVGGPGGAGTTSGTAGTNTTFGAHLTAYAGGSGSGVGGGSGAGGGGGGWAGIGGNAVTGTGGSGGIPEVVAAGASAVAFGGGGGGSQVAGGAAVNGGGGGGGGGLPTPTQAAGGQSLLGGGGGGGGGWVDNLNPGTEAAGGAGGKMGGWATGGGGAAGGVHAAGGAGTSRSLTGKSGDGGGGGGGTNNGTGAVGGAGGAPGGGGGGGGGGTSTGGAGSAGGRGEVLVYTFF